MKVKHVMFVFLFLSNFLTAQDNEYVNFPVDTIQTSEGDIVIFSDKSWEFLEILNFDGITNPWLHEYIENDTAVDLKICWDNNVCFSYPNNPVHELKDTIWMCVVDDSVSNNHAVPHTGEVTSTFRYRGRRFHHGVDIDLEEGDTVVAAFDGIVRYTKYNKGGFGNLVIIRHFNGLETFYAHLSDIKVIENQRITAGEVIGLGGNTGRSYGAHLHFEVRFYDQAINPELIFDFENNQLAEENLLVHNGLFDYKSISSTSNSRSTGSKSSSFNPDAKYHKIRSGDSLFALSLKYKTTVDHLCKLNNLTPESVLNIGQLIKLK